MGFLKKLFGITDTSRPKSIAVADEKGGVFAPVGGKVEPMASLPDPVFSTGALGPCLGVWPTDGVVYAPVTGSITAAMPHAFGLMAENGTEVLVHVGIDTVEMKGDGFTVHVKEGDRVKAGDPMLSFDRNKVAKAGHPDVVMTAVTNAEELASLQLVAQGEVAAGDKLFQTA